MTSQPRDPGASHEEPGGGSGRSRKERVLHTRISEQLADDLRSIADELRVPVSNLVRNALEEAFSVVETVTDNVGGLVEEVVEEAERVRERVRARWPQRRRPRRGHRPPARRPPEPPDTGGVSARPEFPSVIGWQPLILNQRGSCADCQAPLARGERAFGGVTAEGFSAILLCSDCLDERR